MPSSEKSAASPNLQQTTTHTMEDHQSVGVPTPLRVAWIKRGDVLCLECRQRAECTLHAVGGSALWEESRVHAACSGRECTVGREQSARCTQWEGVHCGKRAECTLHAVGGSALWEESRVHAACSGRECTVGGSALWEPWGAEHRRRAHDELCRGRFDLALTQCVHAQRLLPRGAHLQHRTRCSGVSEEIALSAGVRARARCSAVSEKSALMQCGQ
jgi:hypothetical protein